MNALVNIETLTAEKLFVPGGVEAVIAKLESDVRALPPGDISTEAGRKEISSLAYKIARSKTALDSLGKEHVAVLKKQSAVIDADRRIIRDRLEALQAQIRKPLTDWEESEEARIKGHEDTLNAIRALRDVPLGTASNVIKERLESVRGLAQRDWQEFATAATATLDDVNQALRAALAFAEQQAAQAAELEQLRAQQAERDRQEAERLRLENEQREAAAKAERDRLQAEQIERDKEAAVEKARQEERERAERERAAAHERALESLRGMIADACSPFNDSGMIKRIADIFEGMSEHKRAWEEYQLRYDEVVSEGRTRITDRLAQVLKNEEERRQKAEQESAERAAREKAEAIEAERRRQEEEAAAAAARKATEEAAEQKRQANKRHRAKIHREITTALSVVLTGNADEAAALIEAIDAGRIPHLSITY